MGYCTDFSGSIDLPGLKEKDVKRLENILRRNFPHSSDEIRIEKNGSDECHVAIYGVWSNKNDEFQKFVMSIVRAFPKSATGWIDACGDERDDNWALEIGEGKVMFVTYELVVKDKTEMFDAKGGRHHD